MVIDMILAVDIGNTTIGFCGLQRKEFPEYEMYFQFKMDNDSDISAKELESRIWEKLQGEYCNEETKKEMAHSKQEDLEAEQRKSALQQETAGQANAVVVKSDFEKEDAMQHDDTKKEPDESKTELISRLGITGIGVSSVVPAMTKRVCEVLKNIFGRDPFCITHKAELGFTLAVEEPEKVGADRLCDTAFAAAAYGKSGSRQYENVSAKTALASSVDQVNSIYKEDGSTGYRGDLIIVDLGTSTTINVIDYQGCFLGGSIMPGLETGFRALTARAAQLRDMPLSEPEHFIGKNTKECMNVGVVAGMAGAVDGLARRMEKELGRTASLILTGGCAHLVSPLLEHAHILDSDLLYKGIAYIYEKEQVSKTVTETRIAWSKGDALRDKDIVQPENMVVLQDIAYWKPDTPVDALKQNILEMEEYQRITGHINAGVFSASPDKQKPFEVSREAGRNTVSGSADRNTVSRLAGRNTVSGSADYNVSGHGEENVQNPAHDPWRTLDIYYPASLRGNSKKPVIVSMHGGGWFYGDKVLYRPYTMFLASYGFAVVNFNYRLSPRHKYPCGFLDVCHAMDFLAANADNYGLDLDRLYLVGDSVGAQLVTQYCIMAGNPVYRENFWKLLEKQENPAAILEAKKTGKTEENFVPEPNAGKPIALEHIASGNIADTGYRFSELRNLHLPLPKKIALNCGVYDGNHAFETDRELCAWYLPMLRSEFHKETFLNLLSYMDQSFPECYIMISVNDGLRHHTEPMKKRLEELQIPHIYREFGQEDPADGHVFHVNLRSKDGKRCNDEEMDFFGRNMDN